MDQNSFENASNSISHVENGIYEFYWEYIAGPHCTFAVVVSTAVKRALPLRKNPHFSPPSGLSCRAFVIAGPGKAWIWAKRKHYYYTVQQKQHFPGARGKHPP